MMSMFLRMGSLTVFFLSLLYWEERSLFAQADRRSENTLPTIQVTEKHRFERENIVYSVAFSRDGRLFAASAKKGPIIVWETASGKEKLRTKPAMQPGFSPDNEHLTGVSDEKISMWEIATGRLVSAVAKEGSLIGFDPSGKHFVLFVKGLIEVHNAKTGELVRSFRIDPTPGIGIGVIKLSPDGKTLAYANRADNTIRLCKFESGDEIRSLKGHEAWINAICFSSSGKLLASTGRDKNIRIWDTQTGNQIRKIASLIEPKKVAIGADDKLLAVELSGQVSIRDVASGDERISLKSGAAIIHVLKFNAQGTMLAAATGRVAQVWEISTQKKSPDKANPKPKAP